MNKKRRKIIYVDASHTPGENKCFLGLFDLQSNSSIRVEMPGIKSSIQGEYLAVLLGVYHANLMKYKSPWILSDNESVTTSKLSDTIRHSGVGISWVPREANFIADSICSNAEIESSSELVAIIKAMHKISIFNQG